MYLKVWIWCSTIDQFQLKNFPEIFNCLFYDIYGNLYYRDFEYC